MSKSPDEDRTAWLTVLTTEHFVLQGAAAATITEANSRASIFMLSLSSSLVALGFTAGNEQVFPVLAGTLIPVVFVLGLFTIVRLVDTAIDNLGLQTRIRRIHEYYATLAPDGRHNFPIGHKVPNEAQTRYRIRHRAPFLSTTASTVGAIDAIIGGAAVAFLLARLVAAPTPVAVLVGVVAAVVLFLLVVVYQHRRFKTADAHSTH